MTDIVDLVVGLVALNGGELVSKIRLQKTFYLLEECGLGSGLDFDYRHYGPFSGDLARAADDDVDPRRLKSTPRPGFHAVPYTVYRTDEKAPDQLGNLPAGRVQELLKTMGRYSAVVLELAATVVLLRHYGLADDPIEKVRTLKPLKATPERITRANQLLAELGIA